MDFASILGNIKNTIFPQKQVVSPLPAGEELNPALVHKMKYEQIMEDNAHQQNLDRATVTPTPTPPVQNAVNSVLGAKSYGYEAQHPNFDQLLEHFVFPNTRPRHIPDALAAGQTALESGYGESPLAVNNNNLHGTMQWDAAGNRSPRTFKSASDSASLYADTVNRILAAKGYDISKMSSDEILSALQEGNAPRYEGDNKNPQAYVKTVKGLGAYQKYNR